MSNVTRPMILDETAQAIKVGIKEAATSIANAIDGIINDYVLYGFHIDGNESDPYAAVTYIEDAIGMTPVHMDYLNNTFAYGSWIDAFFMPRPCMVTYDGTVDYYLDPNDYDKKEDGTLSDIGDDTTDYGIKYPGNAMMEWGSNNQQIWTKVVPDVNDPYSGSVYISNEKVDDDYTAWPFINNQGNMVKHFYTAIYNGSLTAYKVDSTTYYHLRSIPRRIVMNSPGSNASSKYIIPWEDSSTGTPTGVGNTAVAAEWAFAINNNPNINLVNNTSFTLSSYRASIGWFTEVYCDIQLINNLLVLIGKNLDSQYVFGNGNMSGRGKTGYSNNGILYTGSHEYDTSGNPQYNVLNQAGLFWGSTSDKQAVKVFGMENWWGNQYRRYAGHINKSSSGIYKHFIKNTFGTEDGSTVIGYTTDGAGYIDTLCETPGNGYIKNCKFINTITNGDNIYNIGAILPSVVGGNSSQYYCDYFYKATSTAYALRGGHSSAGFDCGVFYVYLTNSSGNTNWYIGAALSFKPIS